MSIRRVSFACIALGIALTAAFAIPATTPTSAQAQENIEVEVEVRETPLYSGIAMPLSTSSASVALRHFDGRISIAELHVENGQKVEEGQVLATLRLNDFDGRLEAAEAALGKANYELEKAEISLNHEREVREYNIAKAELDLEAAVQRLENFQEFGKADRITQGKQRVQNVKNSIADQEAELKQLRKLYGKNELASESQEIVVNRSERRLKTTKANLKIEENKYKVLIEQTIPSDEWKLPHAVNRAERALQKARLDQHDNIEKKEKALRDARKRKENAKKKLNGMREEREMTSIKAGRGGTVIFGTLKDNDGFGNGIRNGATVKPRQTIFTIADLNTMVATIEIPVAKRRALAEAKSGHVNDLKASITSFGMVAHGDRMGAKITIDANGNLLIGQRVTFVARD